MHQLSESLLVLRSELSERGRSLGEIFLRLSEKSENDALKSFYGALCSEMNSLGDRSFSEIWRSASELFFHACGENVTEALRPLGACLGGSELERQCAALEEAARMIGETARTEKEALAGERKLSFGLALSAGAFLVIILM